MSKISPWLEGTTYSLDCETTTAVALLLNSNEA